MAQSDLVTKRTIMKVLQELFDKYKMNLKIEGTEEIYGFCSEAPQAIEALDPEYDVDSVISNIQSSELLNIPHHGYCINADTVIQLVRDGVDGIDTSYKKPEGLSDDLDRAISFFALRSLCDEDCLGRNCINCNVYKAKKNAMIGLNFYKQAEEMLIRIKYLKDNSSDPSKIECYSEIEEMLQSAYDYANDRTHLF